MMRPFAILVIVLFSLETHLYAQCTFKGIAPKKQIPLKGGSAGAEEEFIIRSPDFYPVQAFIDGSNLQLEFYELDSAVEVKIVNTQTNEVYCSGTYVSTDNVVISLDGLRCGEYKLEISLDTNTTMFYGDFIF